MPPSAAESETPAASVAPEAGKPGRWDGPAVGEAPPSPAARGRRNHRPRPQTSRLPRAEALVPAWQRRQDVGGPRRDPARRPDRSRRGRGRQDPCRRSPVRERRAGAAPARSVAAGLSRQTVRIRRPRPAAPRAQRPGEGGVRGRDRAPARRRGARGRRLLCRDVGTRRPCHDRKRGAARGAGTDRSGGSRARGSCARCRAIGAGLAVGNRRGAAAARRPPPRRHPARHRRRPLPSPAPPARSASRAPATPSPPAAPAPRVAAVDPSFPQPPAYGVYALVDNKLVELAAGSGCAGRSAQREPAADPRARPHGGCLRQARLRDLPPRSRRPIRPKKCRCASPPASPTR